MKVDCDQLKLYTTKNGKTKTIANKQKILFSGIIKNFTTKAGGKIRKLEFKDLEKLKTNSKMIELNLTI